MPRHKVMQHFISQEDVGENIGLVLCKQFKSSDHYQHVFITDSIFESTLISNKTSEICTGFPLYLKDDPTQQDIDQNRLSNLNHKIAKSMAKSMGLYYTYEKQEGSLTPIDILDYIYAVLHSRKYREKYREFLKTGFPKIPYPTEQSQFWELVEIGSRLRSLHLMKSPDLENFITSYANVGSNQVESVKYISEGLDSQSGSVFINEYQSFENMPRVVWDYCIGGYQPAQKWLKDRKSRALSFDDVTIYQRMIVALNKTVQIMLEIDNLQIVK
ncbi:MAG: hypothetical protein F4X92_02845 [Gammaproteobacteria bacterium]|nr:hypothetical protein [Gammaproteobacteria bacterium]